MLHPADPYVEKFVREVNRGRVSLASSVITQLWVTGASEGLLIAAEATLEDALAKWSAPTSAPPTFSILTASHPEP